MSKKSCFRGPFNKQHGKGDQTHLKPEPHKFYQIYWSLLRQLGWEKSLLVISKILGLFVKTLNGGQKKANSDAIISETKIYFSLGFCIFEV